MQDALRFVESCIERYAEQAWRAAYVMLSNAADADDLLQQAFLVAWRKADAAPRDNAWPWLATIIANEARNFRRKRARRQGVSLHSIGEPAMLNDPDKQLQRAELSALVHVSLAELGEEQRIAIVLTHLSGLSQSQAADALGVPLNTLKARVRRGLESMRDALGKHAPGLEGTLKNLNVGAPPGGFMAAKAAWSASLSANVAAAGTATGVAAGATGIKTILVTAAATVVLTVGAIVGVALQPKETPTPYTAAAINNEPIALHINQPETIGTTPAADTQEPAANVASKPPEESALEPRTAETVKPDPVAEVPTVPTPDPPKTPESAKGLELAYAMFEHLLPLVLDSANEESAKEVRRELKSKSPWARIGAVEAVRQGELDKTGSGKVFLSDALALLDERQKKLHELEIVTVNVLSCLATLAQSEDRADVVRALVDWQSWSENTNPRLRDMAGRVLMNLTGVDCELSNESLDYWEWWLFITRTSGDIESLSPEQKRRAPEKRSNNPLKVFKGQAVGNRIILIIDVSQSMLAPISAEDLPRLRKQLPHLELGDRLNSLDLVKAELSYSISQLSEERTEKSKKKRAKDKDHETKFAIATYSSEAVWLTDGWVEATASNCNRWSHKIQDLEVDGLTNMHAGLRGAFGLNERKTNLLDPEYDLDCALTGAHTVIFQTDGYANWSDDSTEQDRPDRWGRENQVGNGEYVMPEQLVAFVTRQNRFRKVMIHTVGLGNHDKELMKEIAKCSDGYYTDWFYKIDWK